MPGTSPGMTGWGDGAGSRRRHGHRVDKSLPGRHSRPANADRECRPLPTRHAGRHFRRQMPNVRAVPRYRSRQRKGAPATPAPPLPHYAKYGIERVPGQETFSLLDHFFGFPVFRPPLPRHARNTSGHDGGGTATGDAGVPKSGPRPARSARRPDRALPGRRVGRYIFLFAIFAGLGRATSGLSTVWITPFEATMSDSINGISLISTVVWSRKA